MRIRYIPFEKLPYTDSCWSLIEGPDERVYAAGCNEHSSGGTAFITRYDPRTETLEYLLDVADVVGEPPANGRATQCKIHYSMIVDDDGVLYAATHLSGPAAAELSYNPWGTFNDPLRSYVGARMLAYDIHDEKVLWTDTLIPWEGCRCLALDQDRRCLYAVGYPRNHFYRYDLDTRERTDYGRIGTVNPQAIWLDDRGRAYTTDDAGHVVVFDPDAGRLIDTDVTPPFAPYQNGWHNVPYDVVKVPGADAVAGVNWNVDPYLWRIDHAADPGNATVTDLGPAQPGISGYGDRGANTDHAGGLVFSAGGELFFSVSSRVDEGGDRYGRVAKLNLMDMSTGRFREVADIFDDETGRPIGYISRAVRIGPRDLVMGIVGYRPTGIVHVTLDDELAEGPHDGTLRRYWG